MNQNYLQDKTFLFKLDNCKNKKKFLKMIVLSYDEYPIQEIQGRAISGTLNCNTNSSIRRTCSFQIGLRAEESSIPATIDNIIGINKKFQLYIGYENPFKEYIHYGEIIWFNLGIYIINSYSLTYNSSGIQISISGQDKMSQLNGNIGGTLPASTVFHEKYIYNDDGTITIQYPTIVQIIREAVNHFGGEDLNKIFINDLDEKVKVLMEYKGDTRIWFVSDYSQFRVSESEPQETDEEGRPIKFPFKYEYGDTIGYRWEDFTYPGELILSAGDTVVTLLDKIVSVLGNYEYFYDTNGNFIFQEIKNYLNTSFTPIININGEEYFKNFSDKKATYSFNSSQLLTSLSNTPNISDIRNDFVCWGTRTTSAGSAIGIRYHLAIDKKPDISIYPEEDQSMLKKLDWREIIYRQLCEDNKRGTNTSEYSYYNAEMTAEWRNLYCPYTQENENLFVTQEQAELATEWKTTWEKKYPDIPWTGWNPSVYDSPKSLNYFLDFIDSNAEVGKYSIKNIGRRTEAINDSEVTSIYIMKTPDVIFINSIDTNDPEIIALRNMGQKVVQITDEQEDWFTVSSQGKSCYDVIRECLYKNLTLNTTLSIQCFPIYYLEPNTLIEVQEPKANTYGNFLLQSFSLPLGYSGTMNISAIESNTRV